MQIVYFSRKAQLWSELASVPGQTVFIAPSPAKADSLRAQLRSSDNPDVITINNFTTQLLNALWTEEEKPRFKRKADLLIIFGFLKSKFFPTLGYEQFIQAYNLFSDLRSFTLNHEVLSQVLDEQPEEIREVTLKFWQLLESLGYSDEHSTYHQIAEALRGGDEIDELKKNFVFWGFQHLNGQQVDLLKALAIRYTVIIPFPLSLKDKLKRSDWVHWLQDSNVTSKELEMIPVHPKGEWTKINSREVSLWLQSELQQNMQVILGVAKLGPEHMDIIPSSQVNFKIPHELVSTEIEELTTLILNESPAELPVFLASQKVHLLATSLKRKMPFKMLKAIQLFEEAFQGLRELTDEAFPMDPFSVKLLRDVVLLNQPRTSYVPLSSEQELIELKDMSTLEDIDRNRPVYLCIDDRFQEIQSLGQNYTESIQKHLGALGPLKRNDLDLGFKQWEFENLFSECNVKVLMPEAVLKHSLVWKRMFTNISLEPDGKELDRAIRKIMDPFATQAIVAYEGGFSASRLQSYVDCPRKFYYSFVEKLEPQIELENDIDQKISGTLIHKIIEEYHRHGLGPDDLEKLTHDIFTQHLKTENLVLPVDVFNHRKLTFTHRARNGIGFLGQIEDALEMKFKWIIEEKFLGDENFPLRGSMDCLGVSGDYLFLLDFKSSKESASTNTKVESFESLQLWVYSLAARLSIKDFASKTVVIGYVVLDDSSKSNLLSSDEDLVKLLKSKKVGAAALFKDSFSEKIDLAWTKIQELMKSIKEDRTFKAEPVNGCKYCTMINVCPRGPLV